MANNWELGLIAVVEKEIAQLTWLIEQEQAGDEEVEANDIHAQVSRIGGLTDLVHADGLPLSETGIAKLRQQGEKVMALVRERLRGGK